MAVNLLILGDNVWCKLLGVKSIFSEGLNILFNTVMLVEKYMVTINGTNHLVPF